MGNAHGVASASCGAGVATPKLIDHQEIQMLTLRSMLFAALMAATIAHAQTEPDDYPKPPTAELMRLAPFLGSYSVTADYLGQEWLGTLDIRPAVKGWYVEWEINVQSDTIDRQLRMLITWSRESDEYRVWRFETLPPGPSDRIEGVGRFEGDDFVMEWNAPTPWGEPGLFRNRLQLTGSDTLTIVSEGEPLGKDVIRIGVTTARRKS